MCAKGYPKDVMGYHRELTSHIRYYKDSLAKNVNKGVTYSSSAAEFQNLDDDCDDSDDSVSKRNPNQKTKQLQYDFKINTS
jgi:hypothetical protein